MRTTAAAALALFAAVPSLAALSVPETLVGLRNLTAQTKELQASAKDVSIINGILLILDLGPLPKVIYGFANIVTSANDLVNRLDGSTPVAVDADATTVSDAFKEFSFQHVTLINLLIARSGLFNTLPIIGAPVADVLRNIEDATDDIAIALNKFLPTKGSQITEYHDELIETLKRGVDAFNGILSSNTYTGKKEAPVSRVKRALYVGN